MRPSHDESPEVAPSSPPSALASVGLLARQTVARLGWLPLILLALVAATYVVTVSVPVIKGYTWLGPYWSVRSVVIRQYFPCIACAAWLLGRASRTGFKPLLEALTGNLRSVRRLRHSELDLTSLLASTLVAGCVVVVASCVADYGLPDLVVVAGLAFCLHRRGVSSHQLRAFGADALRAVLLLVAASYVFTVVKALLFRVGEVEDAGIIAFETALFGTPPHRIVAAWVSDQPWLVDVFDDVYSRIFEHMAVASLFLVATGRTAQRARLWSALAVCYLLGGPAYYLLPGVGPAYFEPNTYQYLHGLPLFSNQMRMELLQNTQAMTQDTPILLPTYTFIACMPSLHMAHEFVMLYYARFSKPFFVLSAIFTALSGIAILAMGWHYAVDAVGGALLAAVTLAIVELSGDRLLPARHAAVSPEPRPRRSLAAPGLCALALLAHAPALRNTFLRDDVSLIVTNPHTRLVSGLWTTLTSGLHVQSGSPALLPHYRPLAGALNWLSWQLYRTNAAGHHLLSVLLHAGVAWLTWRVLLSFGVKSPVAFALAALAVVHPVTSATVAYISAHDVLLGWCVLLGVLLRLRRSGSLRTTMVTVLLGTLAASLAHESLLLLSLSLVVASVLGQSVGRWRALAAAVSGYGVAVATVCALRALVDLPAFWSDSVLGWWRLLAPVGLRALKLVFAPLGLSPALLMAPASVAHNVALVVGGGAALLALFALSKKLAPSLSAPAACGCSLMALVVVAYAVAAARFAVLSDQFAYGLVVALAFVAAAPVAYLAQRLATTRAVSLHRWAAALVALLLVAATPFTWAGDAAYRTEQHLTRATLQAHPDDPHSQLAWGLLLLSEGKVAEAQAPCARFRQAVVASTEANLCLAWGQFSLEQYDAAVDLVTPFVNQRPGNAAARSLLVTSLLNARRLEEARTWVRHFQAWSPRARDIGEFVTMYERAARHTGAEP